MSQPLLCSHSFNMPGRPWVWSDRHCPVWVLVCDSCRFDIMWLLLDEHDEANDKRLAAHIIAVHQGRVGAPPPAAAEGQAGSSRQQQRRQQEGASTSGVSGSSSRGVSDSSRGRGNLKKPVIDRNYSRSPNMLQQGQCVDTWACM